MTDAIRRELERQQELRPLLFSIAYRMMGSVAEAEDLVQDAYLRYHHALEQGQRIEDPKAYLCTITTRLAIDQLRSSRARLDRYPGTWLPEPLLADADADPAAQVGADESLSSAFLLLLERLTPTERAVFLLHDVFEFDFNEIAEMVGKSHDNCRQMASRARRRVREEGRTRFRGTRAEAEELSRRFFAACEEGDLQGLLALLAPDAVFYGDGGGKGMAVAAPVAGGERVARFLRNLLRASLKRGVRREVAVVNGQPGAVFRDDQGRVISVMALSVGDGGVRAIHSVINPDKLQHLGPISDWGTVGA